MRLIEVLLPVPCARCGEPPRSPCSDCLASLNEAPNLAVPDRLSSLTALTAYDERSAVFITDAKYRNSRSALDELTRWAVMQLPDEVAAEVAVVTWAPTTSRRRRERGFDQAQLLARNIARALHRPTRRLLRRVDGAAQTGRSREQRLRGPQFVGRSTSDIVLVVDDVCTTGATLSSAAKTLLEIGAPRVHGIVLARTPLPGSGSFRSGGAEPAAHRHR
jgi:predicted amidophosphoribosyltransferase